jgi:hypothetical protein
MYWPVNSFAFAPLHDSPPDVHNPLGHDATGKFHHGLDAWRQIYGGHGGRVTTLKFDNHARAPLRRREIMAAMSAVVGTLDAIAYFGHGSPNSMASASVGRHDIPQFAAAVRAKSQRGVIIALYACDCGRANGFAEALQAALADIEAVVFAHPVFGDSVNNPAVVRFPGGARVHPQGRFGEWATRLRVSNLWARFPFMTAEEIVADLDGHPPAPRGRTRRRHAAAH